MLPLFGLFFFPSTHSYSEKPFILMVRNFAIYVYSHCFVCSSIYVFSLKSLPFQWNSKMWSAWNVCHLAMSRLQFSYSNGTENHSLITTCRCARHQSDIKTSQHENSETFNCGKMYPNENNGWRWANVGEEKLEKNARERERNRKKNAFCTILRDWKHFNNELEYSSIPSVRWVYWKIRTGCFWNHLHKVKSYASGRPQFREWIASRAYVKFQHGWPTSVLNVETTAL